MNLYRFPFRIKRYLLHFLLCGLAGLILLFSFSLAVPAPVNAAADEITISSLQIDIWPEYDRPAVLVTYRIRLSNDTILPASLSISIPKEANRPSRLAVQELDGMYYDINFSTTELDEEVIITFTTPSQDIQLEYYDPRLVFSDTLRNYALEWKNPYLVNALTIRVQQPVNTVRMTLSPDMGSSRTGQDGLDYFLYLAGSLDAGRSFVISMEYEKPDFLLSSGLQSVSPIDPINSHTNGRTTISRAVPWAAAILGIILIVTGGLWYWQIGKRVPSRVADASVINKNGPSIKQAQQLISQTYIYCTHCGKRMQRSDRYCRDCGKEIDLL